MSETVEAPPSFNSQIARLGVGETVGISRRLERCSPEAADLGEVKAKMRQSVNPAVSRARRKYQMVFETDCGEFLTQNGHVIAHIAVTRTA